MHDDSHEEWRNEPADDEHLDAIKHHQHANGRERAPVQPLGHHQGIAHLISAAGELRSIPVEKLERGRGVEEIFLSPNPTSRDWAMKKFSWEGKLSWSAAGQWLVRKCVETGIIDLSECELRGRGIWRDEKGDAIAHVGDALVTATGELRPLDYSGGGTIWLAKPAIGRPSRDPADIDDVRSFFQSIQGLWGFKDSHDAAILAGWVATAILGGYPTIRPTLVLNGARGTGKSELMSVVAEILGSMALPIFNDATEAGLRQSTNGEARAILFDEAEGGADQRKMLDILAFFRRRYGAGGGRISRGRADHSPISFRSTGAAVLAAIVPPPMTAADATRTVRIELGPLPNHTDAPTCPSSEFSGRRGCFRNGGSGPISVSV